ncbi:hypothetical protein IPC1132_10985 [Pseudomonas aeruginosa]|uniref:hypothetical protein n=1 Tax=Pseudomonas aeruginosa TaxID=287 RepID=UPI000FC428D4|nr:hypothetical protein [Pseudomonas aeruginosa]RUF31667.1 hypothetical protein IPC1132_10985 [Pseudomonas aeruginosa]
MSELNKESADQEGGDERAAKPGLFCRDCGSRLMVRGVCSIYCPKCVYEGLDDRAKRSTSPENVEAVLVAVSRAALEQPSPDAPYADDIAADLERSDWTPEDALRWYAAGKHFDTTNGRTRIIDTGAVASNALKHLSLPYLEMKGDAELTEMREANAQPSPAQAEAERPEVVARVVHSSPVVLGQCGPLNANDELMTVAQHAASVARWAEMFNRVEQQRDAALARVEQQERTIAGMNEAHAKLAGLYEAAQAQHSVPVVTPEMVMAAMAVFRLDVSPFKSMEAALIAALRKAAAPGKAQHSVPEEFIGRLSEFLAQRGATGKALLRELRTVLAAVGDK